MSEMSGWQLSGDAPTAYTRFALKIMEPWDGMISCLRRNAGMAIMSSMLAAAPASSPIVSTCDCRQAFVAHAVERLANYVDDAGLAVPQENHFLTAAKSG